MEQISINTKPFLLQLVKNTLEVFLPKLPFSRAASLSLLKRTVPQHDGAITTFVHMFVVFPTWLLSDFFLSDLLGATGYLPEVCCSSRVAISHLAALIIALCAQPVGLDERPFSDQFTEIKLRLVMLIFI